jgi:archaellin
MHELLFGLLIAAGGSLINFFSTKVYNSITGNEKSFIWKDQYPKLKSFNSTNNFNELKRKTKIIVIDDENSFPVNLFQSEGYSIDKWNKVIDYGKLENGFYDIIVLDIKGVALHISDDDGLGVLESIKKKNPAQIIIAYSQHSFDLSKAKFWELADEKIAKPSDFLKMKSKIDNLINTQFKPTRYIETLHQVLTKNNVAEKDLKRLDIEIVKIIKTNKRPDWDKMLEFINDRPEVQGQISAIGNTILKFF